MEKFDDKIAKLNDEIKEAKKSKDKMSRAEKKKAEKIRKARLARGESVTDSEDDDWD